MVDLPPVKAPYTVVTTTDLKSRAIKSSMGVLPLRRSESIPELNLVHLRGRSVAANDPETVDDFETSRVGTNTPRTPRRIVAAAPPPATIDSPPNRRQPLPAILPMVGTTHTAPLLARHAPMKPVVNVPPVKKRKVDVVLIESEALERGTPRSVVKQMIKEARLLSQSGGVDRNTPYSRLSSKQLYVSENNLIDFSISASSISFEDLIRPLRVFPTRFNRHRSRRTMIHRVPQWRISSRRSSRNNYKKPNGSPTERSWRLFIVF